MQRSSTYNFNFPEHQLVEVSRKLKLERMAEVMQRAERDRNLSCPRLRTKSQQRSQDYNRCLCKTLKCRFYRRAIHKFISIGAIAVALLNEKSMIVAVNSTKCGFGVGYWNAYSARLMKVNGNGQAKILTSDELKRLFTEGFTNPRDRALFGICLFTGCRVSEALGLMTSDFKGETVTFRKSTTKGKLKTRVVDIQPGLAALLADYHPSPGVMFPGMRGVTERLTRYAADKILRDAAKRIGIDGMSTHSFRRTALNQMSSAGVPLRHIQEISGHNDLGTLQRYLEVTPEQRRKAISVIGF